MRLWSVVVTKASSPRGACGASGGAADAGSAPGAPRSSSSVTSCPPATSWRAPGRLALALRLGEGGVELGGGHDLHEERHAPVVEGAVLGALPVERPQPPGGDVDGVV